MNSPVPSATPGPSVPRLSRENPWPGLAPFTERDAAFFFGREPEATELLRLVRRSAMTVVYGRSGLGKTSLLRAGVFPQLETVGLLPVWLRLNHAPQAAPLAEQVKEALAKALDEAAVDAPRPCPVAPGDARPQTLWEYFHQRQLEFWGLGNRLLTPVLVFDQFEELFTLGRRAESLARSRQFLHELEWLLEHRPPSGVRARMEVDPAAAREFDLSQRACKAIVTLREDFLADLESLRGSIPSLGENRYRLQPMSGDQGLEAVSRGGGPLVTTEVAREIVNFVSVARQQSRMLAPAPDAAMGGVEPALLSVFCTELNARRIEAGQDQITPKLLVGCQQEIIRGFYDRAFEGLDPRVRDFVEDRLLTSSGYRNRVAMEDAQEAPGVNWTSLDTLVNRRILQHQAAGNVDWIEMSHDLLTEPALASRNQRKSRQQLEVERERARQAEADRQRAETEQKRAEAGWRQAEAERQRAEEERSRAEKHRNLALLALAGILLVSVGLVIIWVKLASARDAEANARLQMNVLLEFQVGGLQKSLRALGRLDLLERLQTNVLSQVLTNLTNPNLLRLRAQVLLDHGDLLLDRGKSLPALQTYTNSLQIRRGLLARDASNPDYLLGCAASLGKIAKVLSLRADFTNALAHAQEALAEAQRAPDVHGKRKVTSDAYAVLGDIYLDRGSRGDALLAYSNCLSLRLAIDRQSTNKVWSQRQVAMARDRLGDIKLPVDFGGAWSNYTEARLIRESLAATNQDILDLQEELSTSWRSLGYCYAYQGRVPEALLWTSNSLSIRQRLAKSESQNTRWRQLTADSYKAIGDLYVQSHHLDLAFQYYSAATNLYEPLAQMDPVNAVSQGKLAIACGVIGDVLRSLGERGGASGPQRMQHALTNYQRAYAMRHDLASRDPENASLRRGRALSLGRLGEWHFAQREYDKALSYFRQSLELRLTLAAKDMTVPVWQYDLCVGYSKLATVLEKQGDLPQAILRQNNACWVAQKLVEATPDYDAGQLKLAECQLRLATLLGKARPRDASTEAQRKQIVQNVRAIGRVLTEKGFVSTSLNQLHLELQDWPDVP